MAPQGGHVCHFFTKAAEILCLINLLDFMLRYIILLEIVATYMVSQCPLKHVEMATHTNRTEVIYSPAAE